MPEGLFLSRILKFTGGSSGSHRFERVMRPHFDAIYGAASRFAASQSDVEDLVQDVCLKAFLNLDELESMEYPRAWLIRVLYNLFIDGQRKNQRSPLGLIQETTDDEANEFAASKQYQPDEQVDRMMQIDNILGAMKMLDKEQCVLLIMHDVDGYKLKELQSLTGLPLGTLKSRLHRTRVKLGRLLRRDATGKLNLSIVGKRNEL
jgi:RNA polymerase sigma-70 factor (ECF subfamily)